MTPNEITTLIAGSLKKELDMPFKLQLMKRVNYWRSRSIRNSLDKDPKDRKFFKQLPLYMTMVKSSNVPCCSMFEGCEVAVTIDLVPKPLRANNILFDFVGAADGMTPFYETTAAYLPYLAKAKYSKRKLYYLWEDGKIIVYGNPNLPLVRIDGIFDDPEQANKYACKPGEVDDCEFWNKEYPFTGDIMQLIVQMILQVDYNLKQPVTPDTIEVPVSPDSSPNQR